MSEQEIVLAGKEGKELVPELYALRAGLSVISQEKDKLNLIDGKIKQLSDRNESLEKDAYKKKKSTLRKGNEKVKNLQNKIRECEKEINLCHAQINGIKKKSKLVYFLKILLLLLPIVVFAIGGYFSGSWTLERHDVLISADYDGPDRGTAVTNLLLLIASGALTLGCVIAFICFICHFFKSFSPLCFLHPNGVFRKKRDIKACEDKISYNTANIASMKVMILTETHTYQQYEKTFKLPDEIGKNKEAIAKLTQQRHEIAYACNKLINELEAHFKPLLDKRDWKNLDLLIYYFETGRADSRKEALQLVDKELQTGTIANAIGYATKEISNSIKQGLNDVRSDMIRCFSFISKQMTQIAEMNAKITLETSKIQIDKLNEIAASTAETAIYSEGAYERATELVSESRLQSALIAKAAISCEEMSEDLNYIRRYGVATV